MDDSKTATTTARTAPATIDPTAILVIRVQRRETSWELSITEV